MADAYSPEALAAKLLSIIERDKDRLARLDDYLHGRHDPPYIPDSADEEYKLLASRSVANRMPLLVNASSQALYVENFRSTGEDAKRITPAWDHFERSRFGGRQKALYAGAFTLGHSFTLAERGPDGKSIGRGLSAHRTACLYEDPANDIDPVAGLTILSYPTAADAEGKGAKPGRARLFDETDEYKVTWEQIDKPKVRLVGPHHADGCPITRFPTEVDLEGRTIGLVEPAIEIQNRLNQSVFDLLVSQTGGAFQVRWATGMAPPLRRDENGEVILDANGNPVPLPVNLNGKTLLMNDDPEGRFGHIPGTPLDGYISAIGQTLEDWAATTQTPPHHMLGQMANLSAEALQAAETSFSRKVEGFKHTFGESWERHFRIVASIEGHEGAEDVHGEVVWRDMEVQSMSQAADALGKLAEQLEVPKHALWERVPNVTATELRNWHQAREDADFEGQISNALMRSSPRREREAAPVPAVEAA